MKKSVRWTVILMMVAGPAFAALDTAAYCSVIRHCMGASDGEICTDAHYKPNSAIEYTGEFCSAVHQIKGRKILPGTFDGRAVYTLLGKQYRNTYLVEGELPINMEMLDYLLDNLPFVAMMINAYRNENYEATYLRRDKNLFRGGNGRSLSGTFFRPFREVKPDSLRNFYWGYGKAKVLMWSLQGDGLLEMDFFDRGNRKVKYRLRAFAFPGNAFINSVMQMGVFQNMVIKKINTVIADVEKAAKHFADGDLEPIQKSEALKSAEGQKYLKAFSDLIVNSGYHESLSLTIGGVTPSLEGVLKPAAAPLADYPAEGPVPLPEINAEPNSSPFFAPSLP